MVGTRGAVQIARSQGPGSTGGTARPARWVVGFLHEGCLFRSFRRVLRKFPLPWDLLANQVLAPSPVMTNPANLGFGFDPCPSPDFLWPKPVAVRAAPTRLAEVRKT